MAVVVVWKEFKRQFLSKGQEYQALYVASFQGFAESWPYQQMNLA